MRSARRGAVSAPRAPLVSVAVLACLSALLVACSESGPSAPAPSAPDFRDANLILLSLDTLRRDGLSLYGGPDGLTPALDAFAAQAVVFEHARTAAPATASSHMSLFTSLYPSVHGVQNVSAGQHVFALPAEMPTLAEVLQSAGFTTVGVTDGGQLAPAHGFARGFDTYVPGLAGGEAKVAEGLERLDPLTEATGRFFLFWHTYEIHSPYVPPQQYIDAWALPYDGPLATTVSELAGLPFREKWKRMASEFWKDEKRFGPDEAAYLQSLYRSGIRYTDDLMARLLGAMAARGLFENSIIVVLSDHGEEFREHGRFQHTQLFEECLAVPLMIRFPGGWGAGRRVAAPVSLMDLMPTLLDLLGVDADTVPGLAMQGHSFADALLAGDEPTERVITSELRFDAPGDMSEDWLIAQHYQGWKFLHDGYGRLAMGKSPDFLYDLRTDPGEKTNQAEAQAQRLATFQELLADWRLGVEVRRDGVESVAGELSREQLEQLVELGYIDASALRTGGAGR